jgi:hypothetical protein
MISGITLAITANALPSQAACSLRPKNLPPSDPPPVRSRQPRASSVRSPEALHQTPNLKPLASSTASLSLFYPPLSAVALFCTTGSLCFQYLPASFSISCCLFALFCTLASFVFNIFYLHCKKTPACRRQGTASVRQLKSNVLKPPISNLEPPALFGSLLLSLLSFAHSRFLFSTSSIYIAKKRLPAEGRALRI